MWNMSWGLVDPQGVPESLVPWGLSGGPKGPPGPPRPSRWSLGAQGAHRSPCTPMGSNNPRDIHGYLWISMHVNGYPWTSMDIQWYPKCHDLRLNWYQLTLNRNDLNLNQIIVRSHTMETHANKQSVLYFFRSLCILPPNFCNSKTGAATCTVCWWCWRETLIGWLLFKCCNSRTRNVLWKKDGFCYTMNHARRIPSEYLLKYPTYFFNVYLVVEEVNSKLLYFLIKCL